MEEQATKATAMSNIPPLESDSTAAINIEDDDDFGTFSGFETAASSDMKSDDDGSPEENAPAAASPPPSEMVSSSSLNEDEFFDAPFEAAGMNQINCMSNENAENEVVAEKMNQPEVDLFSSVEDAAIIPPNDLAAVESKGGEINENNVADSTDVFSAFDGIIEGGGEQNEASHFNQQDDDVGFGEFEGTVSGSPNDVVDMSPSNGDDDDDSPSDATGPVGAELVKEENTSPESGENSLPANHSTKDTNTASLEGDFSAFESHTFPEVNEIAEPGHEHQEASDTTPTPADTFSAFDAFAEIQDAPLPPFGGSSTDVVAETTTIEDSGDNFGEFAGVNSIEKAAEEKTNNSSPLQNYTTEEKEDTKERETTPENEVAAPVPVTSVLEAAPTNVTTLDAAEEDSGDVFGAFEETSPASDAFGAFSSLAHDNMDTAHAEKEQDILVQDDTALVTDATEKGTAVDETTTEEVDDFGDFTASNEDDLPVETDTAFAEEGNSPEETVVEKNDDFGDFTTPENNAGIDAALDEGAIQETDFASPPVSGDETLVEGDLPVEEVVGVAEEDTNLPPGKVDDNDDFGDFTAHVTEAPPDALQSALPENNVSMETGAEEFGDFGDFSAPVEVETDLETAPVAADEEKSNEFGRFTAPVEEVTSPIETTANEDDEFGDFGGFSSPAIEAGAATNAPEGADDEFGNFGDFSAPVEAETEIHTPVDAQPSVEEEDDFGEFGDFAAFDEEAAPADNEQNAQVDKLAAEEDISTPQEVQPSQAVAAEEDEFGDFGDFEESDEVKGTSGENEPSRPVHVLNENVRDMFQKVFRVDNPVELEKGDGCVQLPFDVPMRTVLVSTPYIYIFFCYLLILFIAPLLTLPFLPRRHHANQTQQKKRVTRKSMRVTRKSRTLQSTSILFPHHLHPSY